ncbi:MAG: TM0106 family RecB-like putative nuclease, partial [Candidatus Eremiobacteraeota bacterium]|nr:TM0106 family RecB-like putative nuclease [Candidatus Eremiobacteraeota bacterium]
MQRTQGRFIYSASDLNAYLECKRLTELEALVALGRLTTPDDDDEHAELIRRKGEEHEARYLEHLRERHGDENVTEFGRGENSLDALRLAERETLAAMERGTAIIYQATFFDERFVGRADFLRRIDAPSKLGAWSYEVLDTKLALKPKPYFLIQLCNYGEHVERLQGLMPAHGAIILGDGTEERYRLHDYLAYYRHLKRRFVEFAGAWTRSNAQTPDEYPHRRAHCAICVWNDACTQQREADDHLSLVASMRRDHIAKFGKHGVTTVAALARADDGARPDAMHAQTFEKLRRQARLQVQGRSDGPVYELLPHDPPLGFAWLPAPAAGDVFFDMEGDPLFEPARGLEYLFGCWLPEDQPAYRAFWALDRDAEKCAFEEFVDFIVARRHAYPAMHVYH